MTTAPVRPIKAARKTKKRLIASGLSPEVAEMLEKIYKSADKRKKNPPRPDYRDYAPDSNRIISKNGLVERPHKEKMRIGYKSPLQYCECCEAETIHHGAPHLGFRFTCVVNHSGVVLCDCCDTYVTRVARVVITTNRDSFVFCELCVKPKTQRVQRVITKRRNDAHLERKKPMTVGYGDMSMARALRASSFTTTRK